MYSKKINETKIFYFHFAYYSLKVAKTLLKINIIIIPTEFEGLLNSKLEITQKLTEYCNVQAELFKNLNAMDKIQDKNIRYTKI